MGQVPEIGSVIADRYELLTSAGHTPTHWAFTAFDREVEVELTLWWVDGAVFDDELAREIFEHNVRDMRKIKSPHLLKIFDFGEAGPWGGYYLTLQLGSAKAFESMLESSQPVDSDSLLSVARALASGIEAAYEHGYYHSWLSPSDVVAVGGQIKVAGVGLFAGLPQIRVVGEMGGDTRYIAPEILAGGEGSPASDLYTIAAMLLDISIGDSTTSIADKSTQLRDLEPARWQAIAAALSENPNERPSSAAQMVASLELLGSGNHTAPSREASSGPDKKSGVTGQEPEPGESTFDDYIGGRKLLEDEDESVEYSPMRPEGGDAEDVFVSEVVASPASKSADSDSWDALDSAVSLADLAIVSELDSVDGDDTVINLEAKVAPAPRVSPGPATRPLEPQRRPSGTESGADDLFSRFPEKKKGNGGYIALAVAALVAGGAAVLLSTLQKESPSSAANEPGPVVALDARQPEFDAGNSVKVSSPVCPMGMLHLPERELCMDAYESPGFRKEPTTDVSLAAARSECKERGARLCRAEEWEWACRRKGSQSFSYGDRYQAEICNLQSGALQAAGSKEHCHSEAGVYDLNGNAAEWVEEGAIRGGSALDKGKGKCSSERPRPDRQASYSDVGFRCCADGLASPSASD